MIVPQLGWLAGALALLQSGEKANPLPLSEIVRASHGHSPELRQARARVQAARARVGQQNARRMPQIGLSGTVTRYDDVSELSLGGLKIEALPDHQEALSLELSQLLDLTNQVGTAVSQAKLYALASGYDLASTEADVSLQATTTAYDLLRSRENVKVAEAALTSYQEQLRTTTRLYEGGVGQKIDMLRSQSQVADAERELVRRQNESTAAQSRLNDLLGRPLDEKLTMSALAVTTNSLPSPDRPALIQQALDRRTEVLAASLEVRAAEKGIKLARASTEPQFSVGLSGNYFPTTSFQYVRQSTAAITLGVSIPIYDGGLARDRVNEARSEVERVKARQDRVRRDVALQVQNASLEVETAQKRLAASNVAVVAAKAARDLAQTRYESQVGLYVEVTDAQAALTSAQAAQVDATYDLFTAQARLKRALGLAPNP